MRWILCVPQIIETTDGRSKEQVIKDLVAQNIIHGAADAFELYPVEEWTADAECSAPNGAVGEIRKEAWGIDNEYPRQHDKNTCYGSMEEVAENSSKMNPATPC